MIYFILIAVSADGGEAENANAPLRPAMRANAWRIGSALKSG